MSAALRRLWAALAGDVQADRVVPSTGHSARLTALTAGGMAFVAVLALALSLAAGRLADRWSETLARSATVRISAPGGELAAQTRAALAVLDSTEGVASARALTPDEARALLAPWFGPDLPLDALPIPQLIDVQETPGAGLDAEGLRLRLSAEAPGAVLDDHSRWRRPLVAAAGRLRIVGWVSIGLIALTVAATITLAAQASLAANAQVLRVLRLIGARDSYIVRAFVRRFTLRTMTGAAAGTALGMLAVLALPEADTAGGFLTGLAYSGWSWLLPLALPPLAGIVAFWATRRAAFETLRKVS